MGYCIGQGKTLQYISKEYQVHSNWLRLWMSNANANGVQTISDPDHIGFANAGDGWKPINIGNMYKVQEGDTLTNIAAQYGTSVKTILSLNPDITADSTLQSAGAGATTLCLQPCSHATGSGFASASSSAANGVW